MKRWISILIFLCLPVLTFGQGAESVLEPLEGPIFERLVERRFNELEAKHDAAVEALAKRFDSLGLRDFFDRFEKATESLARKLDGLRIGEMISEVRASTEANREFQTELKAVGGARGLIGEFQRGRAEILAAKAELAKANAELQKTTSSLGPLARLGQNFFYLCLFLGGGLLFLLLVLLFGLYLIRRQINRLTGVMGQVL